MGVTLDSAWAGQIFAPPTVLDIATIESAIAAQLRAQVSAIEVAQFPDKPPAYRLTHRIGAALVAWRGATYGALIDTAAVVQARRLEFEITLLVRDLGWSFGGDLSGPNPGAYALLEAIRTALTGLQLPGCRKMYPLREQFLGRDPQGGLWAWSAVYALETMALEASTQDNFPLFIKGTALEDGGQTVKVALQAVYTFNEQNLIRLPVGNVSNLVVTAAGGGNPYLVGTDYTLDAVNGIITRLASGTIAAGATVNAAYIYADTVTAVAGGSSSPTAPTN
jgi:Gp37 protein